VCGLRRTRSFRSDVFAVMPEFRVSEISGTHMWTLPLWVPASLGLTPSAGMTMSDGP